jgi:hypothetical protein
MDTPTAAIVRFRTPRYSWSDVDYPPVTPPAPDPLDEEVLDAVEYVEAVTWRKLDATMPDAYARMAVRAVVLRTQQQVETASSDMVNTVNDEVTQSQSAGGASESRRDPGRRGEQQQVNPNPDLARLLWLIMTPEAQGWWRAFLTNQMPGLPASVAMGGFHGKLVEVVWDMWHREPYQDVLTDENRSTYLAPVDPGDLPWVPDPLDGLR